MVHPIFQTIVYEDFWDDLQLKRTIGTSQPLIIYLQSMISVLNDSVLMSDEDNRYCMEESVQHAIYHCYDCGYDDEEVDQLFMCMINVCIKKYKMGYAALTMYCTEKMENLTRRNDLCSRITDAGLDNFIVEAKMKELTELALNESMTNMDDMEMTVIGKCHRTLYDFKESEVAREILDDLEWIEENSVFGKDLDYVFGKKGGWF